MLTLYLFHWLFSIVQQPNPNDITGAWTYIDEDGTQATWIMTEEHFSIAYYKSDPPQFLYTEGGAWSVDDDQITFNWEYHTQKPELIGQTKSYPINYKATFLSIANTQWNKADDGSPGQLQGAWVITGRKRDGEMRTMTPGARRTMKILSGTKFQWIAYNVETKQFMGTGGGSYTTEDGRYTENIEFFSRDNSRTGASLGFDFELKSGRWHHSGKSSKGKSIYEIWSTRKKVGI